MRAGRALTLLLPTMGTRDDQFWAEFLGIESRDWGTRGVSYRPHAGLKGFRGFWCFRRHARVVVSAPPRWVEPLRMKFSGWDEERLMHPAELEAALGAAVERSIGPAFQGCLTPENLPHEVAPQVRSEDAVDARALEVFQTECGTAEWQTSGLSGAGHWRHVYLENGQIQAMAGYRPRSEHAGDPCVLTHPDFRGRGCGAAVTRAVLVRALSEGKLLLYQTLESNEAAVKLALSLGYERYANHVAIRLMSEGPESVF